MWVSCHFEPSCLVQHVHCEIDTIWKDNDDLSVLLDRTFKDEDDIAVKNPDRSDLIFREAEITIALISLVSAALSDTGI